MVGWAMRAAGAILLTIVILGLTPNGALAQTVSQPASPAPSLIEPALPADAEFARNIARIRADLLMADALVKERDWVDARPHVNFPREEVYGVIRDELRTYKTPPFDGALRELAHAIAARNIKPYDRALKKIEASLIAADAALQARQKDWPRFTLQVAAAVLRDAADEYDDAVADGRIVHAVGYQSARGLVFEADRMVEAIAKDLAPGHGSALQSLRGNLMRLKGVVASVAAPREARADATTVRRLADESGALMRAIP